MIRRFALCLALLAPVPALARDLPAAYSVTGVAADDVLNVRADPSALAPILGTLGPHAVNVEVLKITQDGSWGLVPLPEHNGWVNMRFLRRQAVTDPRSLPRPLTCIGTEPFWSIGFHPRGGIDWSTPEDPGTGLTATEEAASPDGWFARLEEGPTRVFNLLVQREECSDGMSDRHFGLAARLFIEAPDGNALYSGCCTLDGR